MTAGKTAIYLFKYTTINIGNEVLSRITLNTRFATARLQVMTAGKTAFIDNRRGRYTH